MDLTLPESGAETVSHRLALTEQRTVKDLLAWKGLALTTHLCSCVDIRKDGNGLWSQISGGYCGHRVKDVLPPPAHRPPATPPPPTPTLAAPPLPLTTRRYQNVLLVVPGVVETRPLHASAVTGNLLSVCLLHSLPPPFPTPVFFQRTI